MSEALKKLSELPYFRFSHLVAFSPKLKNTSLRQKVSRWLKKGEIFELKKGLYVTNRYYERHISEYNYLVYLANVLRQPSYVSGAYILQRKGVLVEATYPITSITTKSTRSYSNKLGEFIYYSVSPKLYIGYARDFYIAQPVYVATAPKALFDYLYIKYAKAKFSANDIIERERFNLDGFKKGDIKEFKKYCQIPDRKLFAQISEKLFTTNL